RSVRIPVPLSGTVPAPLLDVANLSLDRATLTIVRVVTDQVSVHDPAGTSLTHCLAGPVGLSCLDYLLSVGRRLCRRRFRTHHCHEKRGKDDCQGLTHGLCSCLSCGQSVVSVNPASSDAQKTHSVSPGRPLHQHSASHAGQS